MDSLTEELNVYKNILLAVKCGAEQAIDSMIDRLKAKKEIFSKNFDKKLEKVNGHVQTIDVLKSMCNGTFEKNEDIVTCEADLKLKMNELMDEPIKYQGV